MNVGLFGTSADPPTIAHREIVEYMAKRFDRVLVWTADNPYKQHQTSLTTRFEMLEIMVAEMGSPSNVTVDRRLGFQYTYDSLQAAIGLWGEGDYTLAIGTDLFQQIHKWYRSADLLSAIGLLIFPREKDELIPSEIERLRETCRSVEIVPINISAVSSTLARQGEHRAITSGIANYIHSTKLYTKTIDS
jgi:nicotinate-nucleotide adenylyltransferase